MSGIDTLFEANAEVLSELAGFLEQIREEDYREISQLFGDSSIGQHCRHIIEFYECLASQYDAGVICYDLRKRDERLQCDPGFALEKVQGLLEALRLPDKALLLVQRYNDISHSSQTTFSRELLYNMEHCVHHQAMVKLAAQRLEYMLLPTDYGVARSTREYRNSAGK